MPSKQQDRGMPGGYGYGSTNDGPPPPGYSQQRQQQQQQQQQQPRRADVYYDYGMVHELPLSFPNHLWLTMMMKKECRCVTEDNMIGERNMD